MVNERLYILSWLEPAPKRQKHYAPCIGLSTKFSCHGKKQIMGTMAYLSKWLNWKLILSETKRTRKTLVLNKNTVTLSTAKLRASCQQNKNTSLYSLGKNHDSWRYFTSQWQEGTHGVGLDSGEIALDHTVGPHGFFCGENTTKTALAQKVAWNNRHSRSIYEMLFFGGDLLL